MFFVCHFEFQNHYTPFNVSGYQIFPQFSHIFLTRDVTTVYACSNQVYFSNMASKVSIEYNRYILQIKVYLHQMI